MSNSDRAYVGKLHMPVLVVTRGVAVVWRDAPFVSGRYYGRSTGYNDAVIEVGVAGQTGLWEAELPPAWHRSRVLLLIGR